MIATENATTLIDDKVSPFTDLESPDVLGGESVYSSGSHPRFRSRIGLVAVLLGLGSISTNPNISLSTWAVQSPTNDIILTEEQRQAIPPHNLVSFADGRQLAIKAKERYERARADRMKVELAEIRLMLEE